MILTWTACRGCWSWGVLWRRGRCRTCWRGQQTWCTGNTRIKWYVSTPSRLQYFELFDIKYQEQYCSFCFVNEINCGKLSEKSRIMSPVVHISWKINGLKLRSICVIMCRYARYNFLIHIVLKKGTIIVLLQVGGYLHCRCCSWPCAWRRGGTPSCRRRAPCAGRTSGTGLQIFLVDCKYF